MEFNFISKSKILQSVIGDAYLNTNLL